MIDLARISPPNRRSNYLLVVRLDNAETVAAVHGEEALGAAMQHLRSGIAQRLDPVEMRDIGRDEIVLLAHAAMLEADFVRARVEDLCTCLSMAAVRHGSDSILLAVSIGHSDPEAVALGGEERRDRWETALASARARLQRVAAPAAAELPATSQAQARYRDDTERAERLLGQVARGETFFAWRPIFDPCHPNRVLQHEALLRHMGERGEQFDCTAAYQALERLGMAHVLDRSLVERLLDELENDPRARLSIEISPQSLSFDLGGHDAAWTEVLARIERRPDVAARLILEFHESAACRFWPGTLTFLNTLRELGVTLGVTGFGSGQASARQLAVLRPQQVKLDSAFLRTALLSERNRLRIGQLAVQARMLCRTVILTGVETPAQIRLAMEEGARWIAGARLGRLGIGRPGGAGLEMSRISDVAHEPSDAVHPVCDHWPQAVQSPVF